VCMGLWAPWHRESKQASLQVSEAHLNTAAWSTLLLPGVHGCFWHHYTAAAWCTLLLLGVHYWCCLVYTVHCCCRCLVYTTAAAWCTLLAICCCLV
jgi:hypothetical protein